MRLASKVAATLVISFAIGVPNGCRSKPNIDQVMDYYVVLDFSAPADWQKSHSIKVIWRGRQIDLPAVFKVEGYDANNIHELKVTIDGSDVTFQVEPACKLWLSSTTSYLINPDGTAASGGSIKLNDGQKAKVVACVYIGPDGYTAPVRSTAEVHKLLEKGCVSGD